MAERNERPTLRAKIAVPKTVVLPSVESLNELLPYSNILL